MALFATAYYGLLRVGKLTSGSHPIYASDVQIVLNKKKILFILYTSKTHWRDSKPQFMKIKNVKNTAPTKNEENYNKQEHQTFDKAKLCPYHILREFSLARPTCINIFDPFFVFSDHSLIKPEHMRKTLKEILELAGYNA